MADESKKTDEDRLCEDLYKELNEFKQELEFYKQEFFEKQEMIEQLQQEIASLQEQE